MPFTVYQATDASAPTLTGQIGSLIALLDACLVTGYGTKAAAGWSKPFIGTNKAVFRAAAGNQRYLRVDDANTTYGLLRGHESMTDVDTGAGLFPTAAQEASGLYMIKSSTADAVARSWVLVASTKAFYLWVGHSAAVGAFPNAAVPMMFFGDFTSYKSGDTYNTALIAGTTSAISGNQFAALTNNATAAGSSGHYCARSHTGIGNSIGINKFTDGIKALNASYCGANGIAYPDPVTGKLLQAPLWVGEASVGVRGHLPGLWCPLHASPSAPGDTYSGSGDLAGKTFMLLPAASAASIGRVILETSDTWS